MRYFFLLCFILSASSCGYRGELYLPEKTQKNEQQSFSTSPQTSQLNGLV